MSSVSVEQFSLQWDNFSGNMKSEFNELLESEDLVDVTLAVDGHFIQAHKIILSAASPYFKSLFKLNPCKHPVIILKGVEHYELLNLLHFIYKGEVNVNQNDLPAFIKTAELLQVKGLITEREKDNEKNECPTEIEKNEMEVKLYESDGDEAELPFKRIRIEKSPCRSCPSNIEEFPSKSISSGTKKRSDKLLTSKDACCDKTGNGEDVLGSGDEDIHSPDIDADVKPSPEFLAFFDVEIGQPSPKIGKPLAERRVLRKQNETTAVIATNRLTGRHFPGKIPATGKKIQPTRVCRVCSEKIKASTGKAGRKETTWWCQDCNVPLCLPNCFKIYHTKTAYV